MPEPRATKGSRTPAPPRLIVDIAEARAARRQAVGRAASLILSSSVDLAVLPDGTVQIRGEAFDGDRWVPIAWEVTPLEMLPHARRILAGHRAGVRLERELAGEDQPRARRRTKKKRARSARG